MIFMAPQDGNQEAQKPDEVPSSEAGSQRRWMDRLAEGSQPPPSPGFRVWYGESEWQPGVAVKLLIGLGVMWLLNVMWPKP